jgi:N-acetyl sugar amidotransferase
MDTSDPDIRFDARGVCNHCYSYDMVIKRDVLSGQAGIHQWNKIVDQLKKEGANKPYDCVIGLSGGVDSSFVAYKTKQFGLRPLAVHLDNGWDSELAVQNIEHICRKLNIDLHTIVLDWEEFRDLQLAFLKASTPDSEIPSDHAIMSALLHTAKEIGLKHIVTGFNTRSETHLPPAWSQGHFDWRYIHNVQKQYGTVELKTFPHLSMVDYYLFSWRRRFINILNYLEYSKKDATLILEQELGWKYYGGKHYESIYTRWYQGYWLPKKFGYDKRRCHLSSLTCSGQITREEALEALKEPTYDPALQDEDTNYVTKKLGLSHEELENIRSLPKKTYRYYSPIGWFYRNFTYKVPRAIYRMLKHEGNSTYSFL